MEKGNSISKMMTVIGKVKYKNFNKIPNFILALCKHIAAIYTEVNQRLIHEYFDYKFNTLFIFIVSLYCSPVLYKKW